MTSSTWPNQPQARGSSDGEFELDAGVFAGVWARDALLAYRGWDERSVVAKPGR
jgi:hypothetical protein